MKTILLLTLEFFKMAYCPYTGTFQNKKRIFGAYFGHIVLIEGVRVDTHLREIFATKSKETFKSVENAIFYYTFSFEMDDPK